jgi:hypothetical protein
MKSFSAISLPNEPSKADNSTNNMTPAHTPNKMYRIFLSAAQIAQSCAD